MSNLAALLQVGDAELHRIAVRSNLSDERVKLLASGATATMPELRALSEALNVPMRAFSDSSSNSQSVEMMFRSAVSEGGSISNDVRIKLSHRVADPISVLSNFQVSKSSWRGAFIKGRQFAEQNAAAFRRLFCKNDQLSPLIRLPQIVERELGLLVLVVNNSAVDGASGYLNGVPFALVAARTFQPRMLFTLAHELGHILLHHDPSMPGVIIDEDIEAHHSSELEREANEFASALLMPSQSVGIALKTARGLMDNTDPELGDLEINFISRIFGVSFGAAALRCERLELLPRGGQPLWRRRKNLKAPRCAAARSAFRRGQRLYSRKYL